MAVAVLDLEARCGSPTGRRRGWIGQSIQCAEGVVTVIIRVGLVADDLPLQEPAEAVVVKVFRIAVAGHARQGTDVMICRRTAPGPCTEAFRLDSLKVAAVAAAANCASSALNPNFRSLPHGMLTELTLASAVPSRPGSAVACGNWFLIGSVVQQFVKTHVPPQV